MALRMHGSLTAPEERCLVCSEKTSLEIYLHCFPQVHHFVHYSAAGPGGKHLLKKFNTGYKIFFLQKMFIKNFKYNSYILYSVTFLWDGVFFPDVVTRCEIFLMYLLLNLWLFRTIPRLEIFLAFFLQLTRVLCLCFTLSFNAVHLAHFCCN